MALMNKSRPYRPIPFPSPLIFPQLCDFAQLCVLIATQPLKERLKAVRRKTWCGIDVAHAGGIGPMATEAVV